MTGRTDHERQVGDALVALPPARKNALLRMAARMATRTMESLLECESDVSGDLGASSTLASTPAEDHTREEDAADWQQAPAEDQHTTTAGPVPLRAVHTLADGTPVTPELLGVLVEDIHGDSPDVGRVTGCLDDGHLEVFWGHATRASVEPPSSVRLLIRRTAPDPAPDRMLQPARASRDTEKDCGDVHGEYPCAAREDHGDLDHAFHDADGRVVTCWPAAPGPGEGWPTVAELLGGPQ